MRASEFLLEIKILPSLHYRRLKDNLLSSRMREKNTARKRPRTTRTAASGGVDTLSESHGSLCPWVPDMEQRI